MSSSDKTQARGEECILTEEMSHDQSNSAPVADAHRLCSPLCLARLDRNEFTVSSHYSLIIVSLFWACFRWGIFSITFPFSQVTVACVSWLKKLTSTIQEWGWKGRGALMMGFSWFMGYFYWLHVQNWSSWLWGAQVESCCKAKLCFPWGGIDQLN